jgi:hypothetical protein
MGIKKKIMIPQIKNIKDYNIQSSKIQNEHIGILQVRYCLRA